MRAAAYVGDGVIRVEEREPEAPGPGQVQLDVAYVGICGTDLHIKHGAMDARVTLPAVIGHEMSGTVAAVGKGVTAWSPRDRVTVMPLRWCGECAACHAGHRHVCERLVFVGIDAPGALQQSWTVDQDLLVRLVVVAIHNQPVPLDLFRVFWRELEVAGARVYERTDFERAVELLAAGAIPTAPLISAVVPLERTADAFAALEGGGEVVKVLVDCQTQRAR